MSIRKLTEDELDFERKKFETARKNEHPQIALERDARGDYLALPNYIAWKYWVHALEHQPEPVTVKPELRVLDMAVTAIHTELRAAIHGAFRGEIRALIETIPRHRMIHVGWRRPVEPHLLLPSMDRFTYKNGIKEPPCAPQGPKWTPVYVEDAL